MVNTVILYTAVITSLLEPEDNNRFKLPVESLILGVAVTVLYLTAKEWSGWHRLGPMRQAPDRKGDNQAHSAIVG